MRYLFSVILFVFVQLISQQEAGAKECSATQLTCAKGKTGTKAQYFKLSKKRGSTLKNILFEDAPFIHASLKKTGSDSPLSSDLQEYFRQSQISSVKFYQSFLYRCYSFIFDYLYPKHVFW